MSLSDPEPKTPSETPTPKARPRAPAEGPRPPRSRPIAYYLVFLVLVILIPAFAFSGILLERNNVAQQHTVETLTVATTRSVVQAVEREVAGMFTTLRVLLTTESLTPASLSQFHGRAQTALAGTGTYLTVFDAQMRPVLNTDMPFGANVPSGGDLETPRRALDTPDALVSALYFDPVSEQWAFSVSRRYEDDGEPRVATLTQSARNLSNTLLSRELPQGWHVALVDGGNHVIAASQDAAIVGEPLFIPLREGPGSSLGWRIQTVGEEDYTTVTQRSILTGWYVVAWAPVWAVTEPLRSTLVWLLLGGLAIATLAAFAAALVARQIARSVRGLAREARRVGQGETLEPIDYPVRELSLVSQALAEAAAKRKAAETEVRFLMRELAHRSKNQLTVISAMAKQTAQSAHSIDHFVDGFQKRIMGLARSTDLLLAHGSSGITLGDLVRSQIEPFRPDSPARVTIKGPDIRLNVQAAQVMGMAAHELATNAAKYGAFGEKGGALAVAWAVEGEALCFSWTETVDDFAAPDERKGFGTVVLKNMVGGALKAEVDRAVTATGIAWRFVIPLDELDPNRQPAEPQRG